MKCDKYTQVLHCSRQLEIDMLVARQSSVLIRLVSVSSRVASVGVRFASASSVHLLDLRTNARTDIFSELASGNFLIEHLVKLFKRAVFGLGDDEVDEGDCQDGETT